MERIGGQAVINGIMLRNNKKYVVGVIKQNNRTLFYEKSIKRFYRRQFVEVGVDK